MTKMTKIDALNTAIELAKNFAPDNAELMEKLTAMVATEQKRKDAPRKKVESKAHKENVAMTAQVTELLNSVACATTKEIAEHMGLSVQKAAAVLRTAEAEGLVTANRMGKAVEWSIAGTEDADAEGLVADLEAEAETDEVEGE